MRSKAVGNGLKHAHAAVACGTTAQSHDDVSASFAYGICHDLACPVACCNLRVAFLGAEESQSAGFCHLDNSRISIYEILCHNRPHQRISHADVHQLAAHSRMNSLQPSLAAIAHRNLYHLSLGHLGKDAFCGSLIRFSRSQTSLERVDNDEELTHNSIGLFVILNLQLITHVEVLERDFYIF